MLLHIDSIQHFFPRQFIDPTFNIGDAWERFIMQKEKRRMKPKCDARQLLLKILLISLLIVLFVYRGTVLDAALMFDLGFTVSGYSTVWCHINNSALNCEVHMQTHVPRTSQCDVHLGSDIYNFCSA